MLKLYLFGILFNGFWACYSGYELYHTGDQRNWQGLIVNVVIVLYWYYCARQERKHPT